MKNQSTIKKLPFFIFRFIRVVIVLAVAGAVAMLLISLKKEPEKIQIIHTPPSVKVMEVNPVSKVMTVQAYGTIKPRKLVKIAVEVSGRIDFLHPSFVEGGLILKGELLLGLDQRSYKLDRQVGQVRIEQAKTDIESLKQDIENLKNNIKLSRANVNLTQKELKRVKALNKNQFASKNSLDKTEQQYLQAKIALQNISNRLSLTDSLMKQRNSALAMARVNFQKADLAFNKTQVRATFDGLILDKFVETGEYINPGQILGSIYQKDSLDVDVSIPLEQMRWIESFFQNGKNPEATIVVANYKSDKLHVWKAKVARIKARIDETTRTLPMTLEILNPDIKIKNIFDLKPGTFVKCSIKGAIFDNIFVLPRHLLKRNSVLFVVNDNHLAMKKVDLLRKFEDEIYVNGGLNPGDKIVFSPLPGAIDGMELNINNNGN
jgi:RND family efflux transporter MFP subunit